MAERGTMTAFRSVVILYDIILEGFHTPLTREEIADLFHAGRIKRDDPCKLVAKREWRTIDEHFPLLKHSCLGIIGDEPQPRIANRWIAGLSVVAACAVIAGIVTAIVSRGPGAVTPIPSHRPIARLPQSSSQNAVQSAVPRVYAAPIVNPNASATTPPAKVVQPTNRDSQAEYQRIERERKRLDQERLAREESQRQQQALADRMRAENDRRAAAAQQQAGVDTVIPLDTNYPVSVGGSVLNVRVHDNNTSTFDIWINGQHYREVKKEKGITGSRTDETLVYSTGSAQLYYVWELSGKLNHCRLRVRDR
jgi:hypothetical protein